MYKRLKNTNHVTSKKKLIDLTVALKSIKLGAFCVLSLTSVEGASGHPPKVIWIVLKIPTEIEKVKKPHKVTENP